MIELDPTVFTPPALVVSGPSFGYSAFRGRLHAQDILSRAIHEVRVGEARYRLRQPLSLTFYPYVSDGLGELVPDPSTLDLEGLSLIGAGVTFEEALKDWSAQFHCRVQSLLGKRPWELTHEEAGEMAAIERVIDFPAYHRETPNSVRQIGTVTRRRPVPDRVQWENGQVDHVDLEQMPPEFASFLNGQRFEAIAVRDSTAGRLLRVAYVGKLGRLTEPSKERWERLQTFAAAPEGSWDEID